MTSSVWTILPFRVTAKNKLLHVSFEYRFDVVQSCQGIAIQPVYFTQLQFYRIARQWQWSDGVIDANEIVIDFERVDGGM